MKKIIALILAMVIALSVFAGCSSNVGSTGDAGNDGDNVTPDVTPVESGYDGSAVTITFHHSWGAAIQEIIEETIVEFNELYPHITVEQTYIGDYDAIRDQITTEITVGNQPNIATCYSDHVAMYNLAGAVASLDGLIASTYEVERADGTTEIMGLTDEQIADFIDGFYAEGSVFGDGLMYTLPVVKSTEVLYYNKTFFEENNLTVPTTWEEMEAVCAQIKAIEPDSIPLGYDSESNWFINMCMQYGSDYTSSTGDHYLFDNETNQAFVTMIREWYQKGYVTTKLLSGAYTSDLFKGTSGTYCYMCVGSSAGATYQKPTDGEFEVGITSIPQVDPENPQVISQGPSICIFNSEDDQELYASWLFVKYLTTSVEFQAQISQNNGYMPVLKSASSNELYASWLEKADGYNYLQAQAVNVSLAQTDAYYTSPAFNGSSKAREEVGNLLAAAMAGDDGGDVDSLIDKVFAEAVEECEYG